MVEINELRHAVDILEKSENANIVRKTIETLKTIIQQAETDTIRSDEPGAYSMADIIDRNHYFASILWQKEDIEKYISENTDSAVTDSNIDAVYKQLDVEDMTDDSIACGYDKISSAYDKAYENLEPNRPKDYPSEEKIEELAYKIRKLLLEYGMWQDVSIYFNDKKLSTFDEKTATYHYNEDVVCLSEEYCPERIIPNVPEEGNILSMVFEGPFFSVINCYGCSENDEIVSEKFDKLIDEYGLWYEQYNHYNLTCFQLMKVPEE